MKNIQDLRESLSENYVSLKTGKMAIPHAKELANVAGKMISSVKAEMEYNRMTGRQKTRIPFMEKKNP